MMFKLSAFLLLPCVSLAATVGEIATTNVDMFIARGYLERGGLLDFLNTTEDPVTLFAPSINVSQEKFVCVTCICFPSLFILSTN